MTQACADIIVSVKNIFTGLYFLTSFPVRSVSELFFSLKT